MTTYKVAFDYTVPNSTVYLKKDDIITSNSTGLTGVQLDSLFGLGVLTHADTSSKIKLKYNNQVAYLQGDSCSNYGSIWTAKADIPKNKTYNNQEEWELDWEIDVQGVM